MLRPAHAVHERGRALATGVGDKQLADLGEHALWDTAHPFHHLGRVAGEVALEDLPHATRVLQGQVELGRATRIAAALTLSARTLTGEVALLIALARRRGDERVLVLPA